VVAAGQTMPLTTADTTTVATAVPTAIAATTAAAMPTTIAATMTTTAIAGVGGVDQRIDIGRHGGRQHQNAGRYGQQSA
jgi:hypothetical protein